MLKTEIQLKKSDLRNFVLYNLFHNYSLYLLSLVFAFLIFTLSKKTFPILEKNIFISAISIIGIALLLYLLFIIINLIFSGTIRNPKFLQKRNYEITEKKINIHYHEATFPINWRKFKRIKENQNYYFFYINNTQSLIFPKRLLNRHEQHILKKIIRKAKKIIKKDLG